MKTNPRLLLSSVRSGISVAACCAVLLPAAAFAQATVRDERATAPTRDGRSVTPTRELKRIDRDFFEQAAKASMAEVQISRIAASRTSNPEVKRFAQMMIDDHERAGEQLAELASARGVSLPAKEPQPEKWEKRDAKDFDRAYLDKMISDHEDVVKLFQKQARDGDDVEAVAFARKQLPRMQLHLQHAIDLKRALSEKGERR